MPVCQIDYVNDDGGPRYLVLATDAQRVEPAPGKAATLTVTVDRRNGFTGRVPISVMNLRPG